MPIERLARERQLQIKWTYFPLHRSIPSRGSEIAQYFGHTLAQMQEIHRSLSRQLQAEGLSYSPNLRIIYNSRKAQELAKWADGQGASQALHPLLYQGFFAEDGNLSLEENLLPLVAQAGLDRAEAKQVLAEGRIRQAVNQDWERSGTMGIQLIPTFLLGKMAMVGALPYEKMTAFAQAAREGI